MFIPINKDQPNKKWLEAIRVRYPCDREIDRVLTRKMLNRPNGSYKPLPLEQLVESLKSLLNAELDTPYQIKNARWLAGGASKLQLAFDLTWEQPEVGHTITPMVVRMEPAESIVETSRLQEFQLVREVGNVIPAPPCFWVDPEGDHFPYPALIYGFAQGVTKPSGKSSNVSGFGVGFDPATRKTLGKQFVDHLAALHTWDWQQANMPSFDRPASGENAVELILNKWARVWQEDANEDIPLLRLAESWLRENIPPLEIPSMIHGDYRTGNFLYTEHNNRITAWLDWELGHPGDPHEDLALVTLGALGNYAEDGKTFLISGMIPENEFYESYEQASNIKVSQKAITYYRVYSAWRSAINCIGTGFRAAHNSKTHQDIVLSWIMALGYALLEDLRIILEKEV